MNTSKLEFFLRQPRYMVGTALCRSGVSAERRHLKKRSWRRSAETPGWEQSAWHRLRDLTTPEGVTVEVKSAANFQSWDQEKLSTIQFNVEKTTPLDDEKGGYQGQLRRAAKVYVFALLHEKEDKTKVDPLNLDQWTFYVVPTKSLDDRERSQHSITLHSLEAEEGIKELKVQQVDFAGLKSAVSKAAGGS